MKYYLVAALLPCLCLTAACSKSDSAPIDTVAGSARANTGTYAYERIPLDTTRIPGATIDSVFPMPEMLRRFRLGLPVVSTLVGGAMSRQELVTQFVAALSISDKAKLGQLTLSRAEFAHIYFPNTPDAMRENGLSPMLRWDQMTLASEKGISRALTRHGGKPVTLERLDCPNAPVTTGPVTLHSNCTVKLRTENAEPFDGQLFGAIIEHAGRFKFLGYTNDM